MARCETVTMQSHTTLQLDNLETWAALRRSFLILTIKESETAALQFDEEIIVDFSITCVFIGCF